MLEGNVTQKAQPHESGFVSWRPEAAVIIWMMTPPLSHNLIWSPGGLHTSASARYKYPPGIPKYTARQVGPYSPAASREVGRPLAQGRREGPSAAGSSKPGQAAPQLTPRNGLRSAFRLTTRVEHTSVFTSSEWHTYNCCFRCFRGWTVGKFRLIEV